MKAIRLKEDIYKYLKSATHLVRTPSTRGRVRVGVIIPPTFNPPPQVVGRRFSECGILPVGPVPRTGINSWTDWESVPTGHQSLHF